VLAPALAEMVDALGETDRVVGIGEFGPWPAALAEAPVVGGYDRPSVERVLELRADALLTSDSRAADDANARLVDLGVRVVALDTSTYDGVFRALRDVGALFGRDDRAAEIARGMRSELDALHERAADLEPRRVLFVVGRDPFFVAGPGSHIDEMIRIVGGRNVMEDARSPYQQVSLETALARLPEVIVDASDNTPGAAGHDDFWQRFDFLPAVREGRVYSVDPGRLVIPGLRLPAMTRLMGRLIHPERFGPPEPPDDAPAP